MRLDNGAKNLLAQGGRRALVERQDQGACCGQDAGQASPAALNPVELAVRVYGRRVAEGLTGFAEAVDAIMRADQQEAERSGRLAWNPVHGTRHLLHGPEVWDDHAAMDRLLAAVDDYEAEREARQAKAAEAAQAPAPIPLRPTFPDLGVTLDEGQRIVRGEVHAFARRIGQGETPETLLRVTVGGGKSEGAIAELGTVLDHAHAAGREGAVYYHVPNHTLSAEVLDRIAVANPGRPVAIWRGMGAEDPEAEQPADPATPRVAMCLAPELPDLARAAGVSASTVCKACPLRAQCGYRKQARQDAAIWVMAHNGAFRPLPAALPPAAAIIVDEDMGTTGLVGADPRDVPQLALSALAEERTGTLTGAARERLIALRAMAYHAAAGMSEGPSRRAVLEDAGLTVAALEEWAALEWSTAPKVALGGMDREEIADVLRAAASSGFNRLRPRLARSWADLLRSLDAHSVQVEHVPLADLGRGQGTGPAMRLAWRQDFAKWCKDAPKLFLGATTPAAILRHWAPGLGVREVEIAAPQQYVVQVPREFGRRFFTGTPGNVRRAADLVVVELAKAAGPVLVIAQVAVEDRLRTALKRRFGGQLPPRLLLAHHGNLVGLNSYSSAETILVIGRPAINRRAAERLAGIIQGHAAASPEMDNPAAWPMVEAGIRMADGTARPTMQPRHPDATVEALRWSISEGAVLQAIGRGRGVRRPVRVVYLGALALPLTVAEVRSWEEVQPARIEVAIAEAAIAGKPLPLTAKHLAAAFPHHWTTETAAKHDLDRGGRMTPQTLINRYGGVYRGLGCHSPARFRTSSRGQWSYAVVPIQGGMDALADLLDRIGTPLTAGRLDPMQTQQGDATAPTPAPETPLPPRQDAPAAMEAPPPGPLAAERLAALSLRLDAARPAEGIPASRFTAPRILWWENPELVERHMQVAEVRGSEAWMAAEVVGRKSGHFWPGMHPGG
ncbi:hypothetical protein [Roseicella aquatilis]|uniref:Uncharacterized protein n=1 Tax=Roseicella aquatilis TaxID=2527868 RepID=A0A4R4DSI3_9PROT|nr:hypothetical protein [Roseicella aquatilis]TCZ65554.1 hypothetical protein EXY23_05130 [Roseicella aquatilis]